MKMLRYAAVCLAVSLLVPGLRADTFKYKGWEKSPEGMFMTRAEQQQWEGIHTDAEAEQFIDHFRSIRGGDAFTKDVMHRAEMADKYMTVAKTPGSKSLRGKVIILLGPPSGIEIDNVAKTDVHRDNTEVMGAMTGGAGGGDSGGRGGAGSPGMDQDNANKVQVSGNVTRHYHLSYANSPTGKLDLTVVVDPYTGKDWARDRAVSKQLDAAFEAAAQASIKTK